MLQQCLNEGKSYSFHAVISIVTSKAYLRFKDVPAICGGDILAVREFNSQLYLLGKVSMMS